jgi:cytidylate kinase
LCKYIIPWIYENAGEAAVVIMKDVITIDGPSGSGKGTVAKILAIRLGYRYLDTGALYRAVAWKAREENIRPDNEDAIREMLKHIRIDFNNDRISVNDRDISSDIRTGEIGELSSRVSAQPVVREGLFAIQREMCLQGKVVIEGRDTGTTVFPESGNKFYLDAGIEERARRRYVDLKSVDPDISVESVIEDIRKRDMRDSTRKNSPLKKTDDMVFIDSTELSIEEVVEEIMKHLR